MLIEMAVVPEQRDFSRSSD